MSGLGPYSTFLRLCYGGGAQDIRALGELRPLATGTASPGSRNHITLCFGVLWSSMDGWLFFYLQDVGAVGVRHR